MTRKQCLKQVKKLLGTRKKGGLNLLLAETDKLIRSGGIDVSQEERDSFKSPGIVLHVALENLSSHYTPASENGKEIAENLRHF